ncbi:nuclear pore complex protein Nup50 [Anabrus simplex]|uniref:nuclear pore complex protein Nup50 n=1 Tax=Anabrus simplex TaxID=316456 RepID=UPI0035A3CAEC
MSKRIATSELNHDNWNDVEEPEERGTFKKAAPDVIERRVIKAAKRRSTGVTDSPDVKKSPFAGLGSFKMASSSSSSSSPSPFSFLNHVKNSNTSSSVLKNSSSTNNTDSAIENDAGTSNFKAASEVASDKSKDTGLNTEEKSGDYYSKLKALNESVSDWIRLHVNKNPFCILTPIFKDYEHYLVEIDKTQKSSIETTLPDSKSIFPTDCNKKLSSGVSSNSVSSKTNANETNKTNSIGSTSKVADKSPMFTFGNSQDQNKDGPSKFNSIFAKAHSHPETEISKKPSENSSPASGKDGNPLMVNPFASSPTSKPSFFGASASAPVSVGFSFGSGSTTTANTSNASKANEEDYQPPKPVFTPVQEEGAAYSKRCKVFVRKDSSYQDRGVGTLYLKPIEEKTQLIVRADTSIGNLLMNCLLNSTMSPQKMGDKNIMLVCLPTPESKPPPVPVLLKVKTSEDADELLAKLKEFIDKRK